MYSLSYYEVNPMMVVGDIDKYFYNYLYY